MKLLVEYYREFNREVVKEECLEMLGYMIEHGDSNVALYQQRKSGGPDTKELLEREAHKYDLYSIFD